MFRAVAAGIVSVVLATAALANTDRTTFESIDGGTLSLDDWAGQPVLVVNTASLCGFAGQFVGLQELYDTYEDAGLVVLAVPSDDFRQELSDEAEVKEYCEMTFGIDLPMTVITGVAGSDAHPFYQWVRAETGFVPRWNFNKVLLDRDGEIVETWGAGVRPGSPMVVRAIEEVLAGS